MTCQWEKLCFNAPTGALTAITGNANAIALIPGMQDLAKHIVEECMAVGRAEGAKFVHDFATYLVDVLMFPHANRANSMFYDRMAGRMLEYEARNGCFYDANFYSLVILRLELSQI